MDLFLGFQLILLLLQFTNGQPVSKISDGVVATPGEFPFIVAIRQFFLDVEYCSGIIIAEEWVLTVASCLYIGMSTTTKLGTGTKFVGGEHDLQVTEGNEQITRMATLFRHPNRTTEPSEFIRNDLMLIKLQTSFSFNQFVQPAVLAKIKNQNEEQVQNQQTIAGWGRTYNNNFTKTTVLYKADLQELDDTTCAAFYPNVFDENMMCSGRLDLPSSGSCWGDWGGPVVCEDNTVCGIISRNDSGPCAEGKPTLSIKLAPYLDWIQTTMDNYNGHVEYTWAESNNSCGGILESSAGHIRYKVGEVYNPNEKCVWTLRPTPNSIISFRLVNYGIRDSGWVAIASIFSTSGEISFVRVLEPGGYYSGYSGEIFFLTFLIYGDNPRNGTGFSFIFESELLRHSSDRFYSHALISEDGVINYPKDNGHYRARELSTLVFNAGEQIAWLNVTHLDILGGNEDCEEDVLRLYVMSWTSSFTEYNYCGRESELDKELSGETGVIIGVFKSDDVLEGTGFSLQFQKQNHPITSTTSRPTTTSHPVTSVRTEGTSSQTTAGTTTIKTTSLVTVPTTTETQGTSSSTEMRSTSTENTPPSSTSTTRLTTTSRFVTSTTFTPEVSGAMGIFQGKSVLFLILFRLII